MTPANFNPDILDAFDEFVASTVHYACDLWELDGEIAYRRRPDGSLETFEI